MGWQAPEWAHIPLIHGPDGAKLSKRHGALGVEAYRAMGYLPEALRNYLARLGWAHGDDEIFSTEQAAEWFDLPAVGKGAARFDFAKLQSLNGHYIRTADDAALLERLEAILPEIEGGPAFAARLDDDRRKRLLGLMPALKERAKTLVDLFHGAAFLVAQRPIPIDEKAAAVLDGEARSAAEKPVGHARGDALDGGGSGGGSTRVRRDGGPQARQDRAAAPRRLDGQRHLPSYLRRARRARARGEPWTARGSDVIRA